MPKHARNNVEIDDSDDTDKCRGPSSSTDEDNGDFERRRQYVRKNINRTESRYTTHSPAKERKRNGDKKIVKQKGTHVSTSSPQTSRSSGKSNGRTNRSAAESQKAKSKQRYMPDIDLEIGEVSGEEANNACETESSTSEDENEYEVEKIIAHRLVKSTKKGDIYEYRIKWKGYPTSENSWEPQSHLLGSRELIDKYWKGEDRRTKVKQERSKGISAEVRKKSYVDRPRRGAVQPNLKLSDDDSTPPAQSPERKSGRPLKESTDSTERADRKQSASTDEDDNAYARKKTNGREASVAIEIDSDSEQDGQAISKTHSSASVMSTSSHNLGHPLLDRYLEWSSWEKKIREVIEVAPVDSDNEDSKEMKVLLEFKSGDIIWAPVKEAYERAPQKMLQYYDCRVVFKYSINAMPDGRPHSMQIDGRY